MASSPNISLPQIPDSVDPALRDYLTALAKVVTAKQIDDYSKAKSDKQEQEDTLSQLKNDIEQKLFIRQIIQNHVTAVGTYYYDTTRLSANISQLNTSLNIKKKGSSVLIDILINGDGHWDSIFCLCRYANSVLTEIGSAPASVAYYGMSAHPYDNNIDSTMSQIKMQFIDTPNVEEGTKVEYRVYMYGTAYYFRLNSTYTVAESGAYEKATSNMRLIEIG